MHVNVRYRASHGKFLRPARFTVRPQIDDTQAKDLKDAGIRHWQGWLPSARPHSIVRCAAQAFSCGILHDA